MCIRLETFLTPICVSMSSSSSSSHIDKARRIDQLRRKLPFLSQSALAAVSRELDSENTGLHDRKSIRNARDSIVTETTPYGPILHFLPEIEQQIANPFAMVWSLTKQCPGFASLMQKTLAANPPSLERPWHMVLYSDEVVPGNQLSNHNARKVWVLYYSFKEFGEAALCMEDAWICLAVAKSDKVKELEGGMAQLFNVILDFLFGDAAGQSLHQTGIFLEFPEEMGQQPTRVFFALGGILQDGGAHKQVFLVKGDAGSKFCVACRTLYADRSELHEDGCPNLLLEEEQDFATDEDIRGTVQRLAAHASRCSKQELRLRETACGFTHNPHNLLLNPRLQNIVYPITQFMHDWMHTFVVHGVFNTLVLLALTEVAEEVPSAISDLQEYCSRFKPPVRVGSMDSGPFTKSRWAASKKAGYFKCTASEALTLYPCIALFVRSVWVRANIKVAACQALLKLFLILDLLLCVPHGVVTPALLRKAANDLLQAVVRAGCRGHAHPKFHWVMHLPQELERFGTLLSCFVHERKHKMVKRYSQGHHNHQSFERAVLAEVTCHHIVEVEQADKFNFVVRVLPPCKAADPKLVEILQAELRLPQQVSTYVSKHARISRFEVCHAKDVVLYDGGETKLSCGQIWFFVKIEGGLHDACTCSLAIVAEWPLISAADESIVVSVLNDRIKTLHLDDIKVACTFSKRDGGQAKVLVPIMYRKKI